MKVTNLSKDFLEISRNPLNPSHTSTPLYIGISEDLRERLRALDEVYSNNDKKEPPKHRSALYHLF